MSESADYTATSWVPTHDFKDARATYTSSVVDRSYAVATSTAVAAKDLVAKGIKIENPTLVVVSDVTGSMGQWPAVMFGKLPYLMHELKQYLGEQARLLIAAVGDATCDKYPLQIQEPKETFDEAKTALTALVVEGGGGGQNTESYELAAGYFLYGVDVARSVKPIMVFIGDENPYSNFNAAQLRPFGIESENMSTPALFKALNEVFDVYLIQKPGAYTAETRAKWVALLPPEHVIPLDQPERVVDVLFGILAGATSKVDYFTKELTDRQTRDQAATVLTALSGLYTSATPKALGSGKSTFHKLPSGKASKPLL